MNTKIIITLLALSLTTLSYAGCRNNGGSQDGGQNASDVTKKEATDKNAKAVTELNRADFLAKVYNFEANPKEWKFEGKRPAIVDFSATWCGPCRMLAPRLEELAGEYKGKIDVYKIDIDKESEIAQMFGIESVPTLLFIPMPENGEPKFSLGLKSKEELKGTIDSFLLAKKSAK